MTFPMTIQKAESFRMDSRSVAVTVAETLPAVAGEGTLLAVGVEAILLAVALEETLLAVAVEESFLGQLWQDRAFRLA